MRKFISLICLSALITGCASIVSDDEMSMTVESEPQGAQCRLENPEGKFIVTTPGTIPINTSCKPMQVTCSKEGYKKIQREIDYSHKGSTWGNIIAGGGIGYIVDRQTGAGCEYPQSILITLDKAD